MEFSVGGFVTKRSRRPIKLKGEENSRELDSVLENVVHPSMEESFQH